MKQMSRFLSIASVICLAVMIDYTGVMGAEFEKSYGDQLSGTNAEDQYAAMFYGAFEEAFVYSADENVAYAGLSKPVTDEERVLNIPVKDISYSFSASEGDANQIVNDWVNERYVEVMKGLYGAVDAFANDYPAVYWFDSARADILCKLEQSGNNLKVYIDNVTISVASPFSYIPISVDVINKNITEKVDSIVEAFNLTDKSSDVDILKAAHDFVATELSYNHQEAQGAQKSSYYAYTSYGLFSSDETLRSVVCEGYAEAFKVLSDKLAQKFDRDFQTIIVAGSSIDGTGEYKNHEWNQVKLNGKWYGIDVTWDDQETLLMYTYFLVGGDSKGYLRTYKEDHLVSSKFTNNSWAREFFIPVISSSEYPDAAFLRETKGDTTDDKGAETETLPKNDNKKDNNSSKNNNTSNTNKTVVAKTTTTNKTVVKKAKISLKKVKVAKIKAQKLKKKGKAVKPTVKVKYKGKLLKKGKDYTIKYSNNKKKGKGKIVITGKGNYTGKKTVYFTIK
ncbi:MAG: hypothetical protein E7254_10370 [Lachnospiraceae bacterium]|jgi:hypothetical protein|nr:hypothetical protein [Lachnospiraceae bacterium]